MKDAETFIKDLIFAFPEIKDDVLNEDYSGLYSLQIGCFRRYTQKVINENDLHTVRKCFSFLDNNFEVVEPSIQNSLVISYFSKIDFTKKPGAKNLLPVKFKEIISTLNKYYLSSPKNEKLKNFLNSLK